MKHSEVPIKSANTNIKRLIPLIMRDIPDDVFVKDTDFRIVDANAAFLSLYPEDARDSVIGKAVIRI